MFQSSGFACRNMPIAQHHNLQNEIQLCKENPDW